MKKMMLLMAVLLPLAFASCAEEENFPLNGTVWVSDNSNEMGTSEISFSKTTFTMVFVMSGQPIYTVNGTYEFATTKLWMSFVESNGETVLFNGEVNGNKLSINDRLKYYHKK